VGESIAYNFKLRMTEKSSQMDGWIIIIIIISAFINRTFADATNALKTAVTR